MSFLASFAQHLPIIGMVHLLPLPGAPGWGGDMAAVRRRALADALTLVEEGVDGLLVENYGDLPFLKGPVGPETVAAMAVVVADVVQATKVPVGVNVLRNDPIAALAVACAAGARFVRVNVHSGAVATDQGVIEGRAGDALRYRRLLGAGGVALLADVAVKHGVPLGPQPIGEQARDAAYRGLADALVVTGPATGMEPSVEDLRAVRRAVPDRPLLVGSGLSPDNALTLLALADGAIVGTALKRDGQTAAEVDRERVRRLMTAVREARAASG